MESIQDKASKLLNEFDDNNKSLVNGTQDVNTTINSVGVNEKIQTKKKYDLHYLKFGIRGKPIISLTSISPEDDINSIVWLRKDSENSVSEADSNE